MYVLYWTFFSFFVLFCKLRKEPIKQNIEHALKLNTSVKSGTGGANLNL